MRLQHPQQPAARRDHLDATTAGVLLFGGQAAPSGRAGQLQRRLGFFDRGDRQVQGFGEIVRDTSWYCSASSLCAGAANPSADSGVKPPSARPMAAVPCYLTDRDGQIAPGQPAHHREQSSAAGHSAPEPRARCQPCLGQVSLRPLNGGTPPNARCHRFQFRFDVQFPHACHRRNCLRRGCGNSPAPEAH